MIPFKSKAIKNNGIAIVSIFEIEKILNRSIKSLQDIEKSAKEILSLDIKSIKNILIKCGHFEQSIFNYDYWTDGCDSFWLSNKQYPILDSHETEDIFFSAMTLCLELGYDIKDSIVISNMYVNKEIRLSSVTNSHYSQCIAKTNWPEDEVDLPYLAQEPLYQLPERFISCGPERLGLYPVVDSVTWIKKLLPLGIKTIQLRIKNKMGVALEDEIKESISLAKKYQTKLFINDYWKLAVALGAFGVHLGQEDLNTADMEAIRKAGLRLGVSTHCYYEVARAHTLNPSYIACGPIFPTTSKIMNFSALGITQLERWRRTLEYTLVAIGGINIENIDEVLQTKVEGIALISAITHAKDPDIATKNLLDKVNQYATDIG